MRSMPLALPLLLSATVLVTAACSKSRNSSSTQDAGNSADATPASLAAAQVSSDVLNQAWSLVSQLDYIPEWHVDDGCNTRAFFAGAELAAQGITPNSIWIYPQAGVKFGPSKLTPSRLPRTVADQDPTKIDWAYHVAPFFYVNGEQMVVDTIQGTAPLSVDDWLTQMGVTRAQVFLGIDSFSTFGVGLAGASTNINPTASVAGAKKLHEADFVTECTALASQILASNVDTGWTAAQKAQAATYATSLYAHTSSLYKALYAAGLLADGTATDDPGSQCSDAVDNGGEEE